MNIILMKSASNSYKFMEKLIIHVYLNCIKCHYPIKYNENVFSQHAFNHLSQLGTICSLI